MIRPMRVYGLNIFEVFLAQLAVWGGWMLVLAAAGAWMYPQAIAGGRAFSDGILVGVTLIGALVMLIGSGGVRQNRAALRFAMLIALVAGVAWIVKGVLANWWPPFAIGIVVTTHVITMHWVRHLGVDARFNPRFFNNRELETMIQIADVVIEGDGDEALSPIDIALNADHALVPMYGESPAVKDMRLLMKLTEWVVPMLIGRPMAFSDLGTHARRAAVERVIGLRGPFKDVARGLKLLACLGYYGDPRAMATTGYRPFEERPGSQGVDQTPRKYPLPIVPSVAGPPK